MPREDQRLLLDARERERERERGIGIVELVKLKRREEKEIVKGVEKEKRMTQR